MDSRNAGLEHMDLEHVGLEDMDLKNISLEYYENNADLFFQQTVTADMKSLYEPFLSQLRPSGRILDLGCGSGRDSRYFIQKGYQVEAMDGSQKLCTLASEYIGRKVVCGRIEDLDYENEFDGIWACASLVHIEKKDMLRVLERIKRALKERGVLYLSLKYGQGEGVKNGRFFNYYDEREIQKIFNELEDMNIIELLKTADVRSERRQEYWINVLAELNSETAKEKYL